MCGMKKSTRTFLFFIFFGIFLLAAPAVILYSQGYRLDLENLSIVKTGAIFLEPRPAPVELYINENLVKKSNFVFQNIYIGNLLPKTYFIEIKKQGYFGWNKTLMIFPKLVTEAKNIYLFPDNAATKKIADNVLNFYFSPSGEKFAFVNTFPTPQINIYSAQNTNDGIILKAPVEFSDYKISDIIWSNDSKKILFSLSSSFGRATRWVMADIAVSPPKSLNLSSQLPGLKIKKIIWNYNNDGIFFSASDPARGQLLFSYNFSDKILSEPFAPDVKDYVIRDSKAIYISSKLGTVNSVDILTREIQQLSSTAIPNIEKLSARGGSALGGKNAEILERLKDPYLIIVADKSVYILNKKTGVLNKIAGGIESAIASSDSKKLLMAGKNTLSVYWLEDVHIQPFHDAGDKEIIHGSDQDIQDAIWFTKNNEYIIYATENSIVAIELDARGERNVYELADTGASELYYDENNNTLYFLSQDMLYSMSLE